MSNILKPNGNRGGFVLCVFVLGGLFLSRSTQGWAQVISFDSQEIRRVLNQEIPQILKSELGQTQAEVNSGLNSQNYSPSLFGTLAYQHTNEKPFSSFSMVTEESWQSTIGVKQKAALGLDLKAQYSQTHPTYSIGGSPLGLRTTEASVGGTIDLWKNLAGRIDRNQNSVFEHRELIGQIGHQIQKKNLEITLRKIFYKLYTLEEGLKISSEMLKGAQEQMIEAQGRFRNSVADRAELARSRSILASRKAKVIEFEFQKESLFNTLREIVPSYQNQKIKLGRINFQEEKAKLLQCVDMIKKEASTPYDSSFFDELNALYQNVQEREMDLAKTHADPDLKLEGTYWAKGHGDHFSKSREEAFEKARHGQSLALNLTIPLGKTPSYVEDKKIHLAKLSSQAEALKIKTDMESRHYFLKSSIDHLLAVIENQTVNRENLLIRLSDIKQKYRQGRISLTEMIYDQDAYLTSELSLLDVQTLIVETMLNYFNVFNKYNCPFNQI